MAQAAKLLSPEELGEALRAKYINETGAPGQGSWMVIPAQRDALEGHIMALQQRIDRVRDLIDRGYGYERTEKCPHGVDTFGDDCALCYHAALLEALDA